MQVPHAFKITREQGKAMFWYKLFSTFPNYLPRAPQSDVSSPPSFSIEAASLVIPRHAAVGGRDSFVSSYLGAEDVAFASATRAQRERMRNLENMQDILNDLDSRSTTEMLRRLDAQEEGLNTIEDSVVAERNKAEVEDYLARVSTHEAGRLLY